MARSAQRIVHVEANAAATTVYTVPSGVKVEVRNVFVWPKSNTGTLTYLWMRVAGTTTDVPFCTLDPSADHVSYESRFAVMMPGDELRFQHNKANGAVRLEVHAVIVDL